ncbi:ap-2 complex subunit sigma [Paraphaeosphaeria sporulosa]
MVLSFILIQNRQGKTRLAKWYAPYSDEEKIKLKGEVHRLIAPRDQKHQSNFVEFRNMSKIIYRRYAGLFFCACVDTNDNELAYLEAIHFFVEVLDAFFGNVCELDLVFNFYKVYAILDEVFLAGEIEETRAGLAHIYYRRDHGIRWYAFGKHWRITGTRELEEVEVLEEQTIRFRADCEAPVLRGGTQ